MNLLHNKVPSGHEKNQQYVDSVAGLVDKYLTYILSCHEIPPAIVLIVMSLIFVEDNQAGRLEDWRSILWAVQKCSFFMALYLAYRVIGWITKRTQS